MGIDADDFDMDYAGVVEYTATFYGIAPPANQTIPIGASTGALPFTVYEPDAYTVTGTSSNTADTVTITPGGTPTVSVTPAGSGTSTITLTVTDTVTNAATTTTFTVTAALPTALNLSYFTPENSTLTVPAPGLLANASGNGASLTAALGITTTNGTLTLDASGDGGFTYISAGFIGTDTFTYKAVDSYGNVSAPATVTIGVSSPAISPPSPLPPYFAVGAASAALPFSVSGPAGDPLTVTASSGNPTVVPNDPVNNLVVDNVGDTVTVTPAASGTATITLTVTDSTTLSTASCTFVVTTTGVPTITAPTPVPAYYVTGTASAPLHFAVSGPAGDTVTVSASSGTPSVVPNDPVNNLVVDSFGDTVTVTPAGEGTTTITLTATDSDGLTATAQFTVVASNPPTLTAPGTTYVAANGNSAALPVPVSQDQGHPLTLSATSDGTVVTGMTVDNTQNPPTVTASVSGDETDTGTVSLTVTDNTTSFIATGQFTVHAADPPTLTPPSTTFLPAGGTSAALPVPVGQTNGDPLTLSASGDGTVVTNVAVDNTQNPPTVTVTVSSDTTATGTVSLTVADGTTGLTATGQFTVDAEGPLTIAPPSPVPADFVTGIASAALPFTVNGPPGDPLTVTASSDTPSVVANNVTALAVDNTHDTVTVTPAAAGTAKITLTVTDGTTHRTATATPFTVTVSALVCVGASPSPLSSLVGQSEALTTTYSETGGASYLKTLNLCVGKLTSPATSLYAEYLPATNLLYLTGPAGNPVGGYALGSAHTITTALGTLNCAQTTVSTSSNQIAVTWAITPTLSLIGADSDYLYAGDTLGQNTGWQNLGAWSISPAPPLAVSVSPNPLTSSVGLAQTLTTVYSSAQGASNLTDVYLSVGQLNSPTTSLYAEYVPATGLFWVTGPTGSAVGGYAAGSGNVITTALGSLNCALSSAGTSGNQLTVTWNFAPAAGLMGVASTYLKVTDAYGASSGWQDLGVWTINPAALGGLSVSPNPLTSAEGQSEALTTTYGSPLGASKLSAVYLCVGKLAGPSTSQYFEYLPATNLFLLTGPTGSAVGPYAAGSAQTITTPLGTLNCATSSAAITGDTLTVVWNFTPATSLIGAQSVYLQAIDTTGAKSSWLQLGSWTIQPAVTPPQAASVSPSPLSSPAGTAETLSAVYSSSGGFGDLQTVYLCIGQLNSPATSQYLEYVTGTNRIYLTGPAGSPVGGFAPGSTNLITTALGTLDCSQTTVSTSGGQMTVNWNFAPSTSLLGSNSVYLEDKDIYNQTSGWQNLGSWTVTSGTTSAFSGRSRTLAFEAKKPSGGSS